VEDDLFKMHEEEHRKDRYKSSSPPQPLLNDRREDSVSGYEMERAEGGSEESG